MRTREAVTGKASALNVELAGKLKAFREKARMTRRQVAAKAGVSELAVSRIEELQYRGYSLGMLQKIARALGHAVRVSLSPLGRGG